MKTLLLSYCLTAVTVSSAYAWTRVDIPAYCDTTTNVLKDMKTDKSAPIILSKTEKTVLTVWMNPRNEVVVTKTSKFDDSSESVTCIVAIGTKDTFIDIPPND